MIDRNAFELIDRIKPRDTKPDKPKIVIKQKRKYTRRIQEAQSQNIDETM